MHFAQQKNLGMLQMAKRDAMKHDTRKEKWNWEVIPTTRLEIQSWYCPNWCEFYFSF
jgi:hypothetical protein